MVAIVALTCAGVCREILHCQLNTIIVIIVINVIFIVSFVYLSSFIVLIILSSRRFFF